LLPKTLQRKLQRNGSKSSAWLCEPGLVAHIHCSCH
jgi:hypothetical protein